VDAATPAPSAAAAWASKHKPSGGPPRSIGDYSAGCIAGAAELPLHGPGFQLARPERGRVFGHPLLIDVIRGVGMMLKRAKQTLYLGDLGQARGGPAPTGHASHQTGLDADVYYAIAPGKTAQPMPLAMVDLATNRMTQHFTQAVARLLHWVVEDPRVARIFVHPAIKRALCANEHGSRAWLQKVRPWWGHHDHFHMRLACPADSPECKAQDRLPEGDGCKEVNWWFSREAAEQRARDRQRYQSKVGAASPLPPGCEELLASP
jgi:penicillin-insensitive murein endopeptidase